MVSIGSIFTLGIIGAVVVGGYALSRNADKVGSAFTRGVEETVVNPLGNWFDNLWKNIGDVTSSDKSEIAGQTVAFTDTSTVTIPESTTVQPDGTVTSDTPPLLNLSDTEKESVSVIMERNRNLSELALGQEGYYYFNVVGSKYDTQQFVTSERAKQYSSYGADLFDDRGLQNIKYIGKSALSQAGFNLFGSSQDYL